MDSEFGGPVNGQHKLKTYDPEVHPKLIYRLALCGLSADRMADCLLIDLNTLYRWRRDHEAFATAWHEGGDHADGKVANALFLRATGWEHMAEKIAIDAKDGNVVRVPYIERFLRRMYRPLTCGSRTAKRRSGRIRIPPSTRGRTAPLSPRRRS